MEASNVKAMREALLNCARYIQCLIGVGVAGEVTINDNINLNADNLVKAAVAALAAPAKNGDVGTPEEQAERMFRFCIRHRDCDNCPANGENGHIGCVLRWAALPYEPDMKKEGGEE